MCLFRLLALHEFYRPRFGLNHLLKQNIPICRKIWSKQFRLSNYVNVCYFSSALLHKILFNAFWEAILRAILRLNSWRTILFFARYANLPLMPKHQHMNAYLPFATLQINTLFSVSFLFSLFAHKNAAFSKKFSAQINCKSMCLAGIIWQK